MNKKFIAVISILLVLLVGCGSTNSGDETDGEVVKDTQDPVIETVDYVVVDTGIDGHSIRGVMEISNPNTDQDLEIKVRIVVKSKDGVTKDEHENTVIVRANSNAYVPIYINGDSSFVDATVEYGFISVIKKDVDSYRAEQNENIVLRDISVEYKMQTSTIHVYTFNGIIENKNDADINRDVAIQVVLKSGDKMICEQTHVINRNFTMSAESSYEFTAKAICALEIDSYELTPSIRY